MLQKLIEHFQDRVALPIELSEIRRTIVELGVQDDVRFCAEELDTGELRGLIYKWHEHSGPYAQPEWVVAIVYPENVPQNMQRAICAKEMVHLCDPPVARTTEPEHIDALAAKVVGPFEDNGLSHTALMAHADKFAEYQWLDLLFPKASRELARQKIANGDRTFEEVVDWVYIPEKYVKIALDAEWEKTSLLLQQISQILDR